MKTITKLALPVALIFSALLLISCSGPHSLSNTENPHELTEADVLSAFGLAKGRQSSFEAAEKIGSEASSNPAITFTGKEVTAYDDEAGTFTVKVKGTKNGKEFEKELTVSGFANPYNAQPWIIVVADGRGELKLDEGIEHNLSIEKYVEKANANIADFFKEPLTFSFEKNNGISVTLGDFSQYTLTATLAKEGTDKVKIVPVYTVKNHKKAAGGSDTIIQKEYSSFSRLASYLNKNYFTEEDVFKYVLDKTVDEDAIKVVANEFASALYAGAKFLESTPSELFSDSFKTKVQKYTDLYHVKDADEYRALDITYGVYNPANGGVEADDYTGMVTADICIATHEQLANQSGITAFKTVTKSGFAKIPDDAALATQAHLSFNLIKKMEAGSLTDALKAKWEKKVFNSAFNNTLLFAVDDDGACRGFNPFETVATKMPFLLSVNGSDVDFRSYLGYNHSGISKTIQGKNILIKSVRIEKESGSKSMTVYVQLQGSGGELKVTTAPY